MCKRAKVNPSPVFVLGAAKSGTTAIAALLAEYAALTRTLDLPPIWNNSRVVEQFSRGELTLEKIVDKTRYEFSADIIKEPQLTLLYLPLRRKFPKARFVFICRDPRDNIRSVLDRLGLAGNRPDVTNEDMDALPVAWQEYLVNGLCDEPGGNYIERLATRWCVVNRIYLDAPEGFTLCRYEDFLADKAGEIRRIATGLGMTQKQDITHRLDHQFQRAGRREVDWVDFFGPANLETINRVCKAEMLALGYSPAQKSPTLFRHS